MSNSSTEIDRARAILNTYQQVHDSNAHSHKFFRSKLHEKNKELEQELQKLKEQYHQLQNELNNKDERLTRLNRQLIDKTTNMMRLQEDFENAIYQLRQRSITKE